MRNVNKMARYMMMRSDRGDKGRKENDTSITRYEYGDHNYDMNFEVDSRFRDRKGREHYDNGKFAPMRSEYNRDYDRKREGGRDRDQRGGARNYYPFYKEDNDEDDDMQMIGFGDRTEGNYLPERIYGNEDEMSHRATKYEHGGAMSEHTEFTPEIAKEWTKKLHNEDGTMGEHWNMEQVKKLMTQRGIQHNTAEIYAVMNSLYSDYCKVLKKYGVNSPEMYLDLAMAFINDKDARPGKVMNYYEYITK